MKATLYIKDLGGQSPIATVNGLNGHNYSFRWQQKRAAHVIEYDVSTIEGRRKFREEQRAILGGRHQWPIFVDICESAPVESAPPQKSPRIESVAESAPVEPVAEPSEPVSEPAAATPEPPQSATPAPLESDGTRAETAGVIDNSPAPTELDEKPAKKKATSKKK